MKYLKIIVLFLVVSVFFSCANELTSSLKKNTDKIIITIYSGTDSTKMNAVVIINDKKQINEIISGISNTPAPEYKCGYNGRMDFFRKGENILEGGLEFNSCKNCSHGVFSYKEKVYSKKLSEKLRLYLEKLTIGGIL